MAGLYQCILPRSLGNFGWSSVYYTSAASHDEASLTADLVNTAEAGLLSNDVQLGLLRISDVSIRGDVFLLAPTKTTGTFTPPPDPPVGAADPNLAVPIKFLAGVLNRATKFLRGVPVTLVTHLARATFTPDQVWGNNQVILENAVTNKCSVVTRVPATPPIYTPHLITTVIHYFVNQPVYMSIRRAGRPFDLPRGRARAG